MFICMLTRFPRTPFTAFVAADMVDLAQAHASYRFIIQDEETENPRILVRLLTRYLAFRH
jgi:hypothetical protein